MRDRSSIAKDLLVAEQSLKDLVIRYEQYFAGVEKREPLKERESLLKKLRRLTNWHIVQTDLRFRLQTLSTRFHTYCRHWDRILRLIDEGRFLRPGMTPVAKPKARASEPAAAASNTQAPVQDEATRIHQMLIEAHRSCNMKENLPDRAKVAAFLAHQRDLIRQKFGNREIEFSVDIDRGKPKIKARAKQ